MIEKYVSKYNEVFLTSLPDFNAAFYARKVFYECDEERFHQIYLSWIGLYGNSSADYMVKTYRGWKSRTITPNSASRNKIIKSVLTTFTKEEKFVEAYYVLANYINKKYSDSVSVNNIQLLYNSIIEEIDNFELFKNSRNAEMIYYWDEDELEYENLVKRVFKFYAHAIFSGLSSDFQIIYLINDQIKTAFLELDYRMYLFGIRIDVGSIMTSDFKPIEAIKGTFDNEKNWSEKFSDLSFEKIREIRKTVEITKIDGYLTKSEIEKLVHSMYELISKDTGGEILLFLKSNAGTLSIKLEVLSSIDKVILIFRVILAVVSLPIYVYLCYGRIAGIWLIIGSLLILGVIPPEKDKLKRLLSDIFKKK